MFFVAALLLALNDHLLKGAGILPGAITGKLSDFCGVFLLPILVVRLTRIESRTIHGIVCATVAIAFALVKATHFGNAIYGSILGETLIDPTDLIALPSAFAAFIALRRPTEKGFRDRVTLVFAGLGCMATSAERPPYDPSQMRQPPPAAIAQGESCAVVSTTGIEPLGQNANVHFSAKNTVDTDCDVDLAFDLTAKTDNAAEVTVRGQRTVTVPAGATMDVAVGVRGAYPIVCTGDPTVNWSVIETKAPNGQPYKSPGGGRTGCFTSTAIAPSP